ncbi:MAG: sensor histidine kinase [Burkholderiaceae bacterium]
MSAMQAESGVPDSSATRDLTGRSTPWRVSRQFLAARVVVGAVLCGYATILPSPPWVESAASHTGFIALSTTYLVLALAGGWLLRPPLQQAERWLGLQIGLDLALLAGLLWFAGGLPSGLAILLLLPNASAAILLGTRPALGFASLSSLMLLGLTLFDWLAGRREDAVMAQAGIMGGVLMATALAVGWLAARLRMQEALARARDDDLRRQFETMRVVIDTMPDGVLVLDAGNAVIAVNRAALDMLAGADADRPDFSGDIRDPAARAALTALEPALQRLRGDLAVRPPAAGVARPTGLPADYGPVVSIVQPDGKVREVRLRALHGAAGHGDLVVVLEDEARLATLAQQLKLAAMGRLSASIAHEIRNPLSAIRHANALMRERIRDQASERVAERLSRIVEDNSLRIDRIIEDVLSVARRGNPGIEQIDARTFLAGVIDDARNPSETPSSRIELEIDCDAPIRFDAGHLRQILLNLLGNALRHASDARGAVRVTWSMGPQGPVLAVSDDGPGVARRVLDHLFEPFMTTEPEGTGLGLHLARELCLANGARIRYSPPGDNPQARGAFLVEPASS